jgi:hypothetical protein
VAGICGYGEGLSGFINAGNFLTSLLVSFSRRTLLHGVSMCNKVKVKVKQSHYRPGPTLRVPGG